MGLVAHLLHLARVGPEGVFFCAGCASYEGFVVHNGDGVSLTEKGGKHFETIKKLPSADERWRSS